MRAVRVLVLLAACLNMDSSCRALPNQLPLSLSDPLLDYEQLDEQLDGWDRRNGTGGGAGCGPCEPDLCPQTRGCRSGLVLDSCGCCKECGNLEGQTCDLGDRGVYYGLCGTGLRCQADPRPVGRRRGGGEDEEGEEAEGGEEEVGGGPVCVCEQQEALCGSDGLTYSNACHFREAAFSRPGLSSRTGPCRTVPVIKVRPQSQVKRSGSSLVFLCEVFAFPMATVEWRKEGSDIVLPGDNPHISVQSRGGPMKFEISSWLQIEEAEPEDSGTYRCIARNELGSVSASAVLGVLAGEELSSYLSRSVPEQLIDATDYDHDFY